MTAPSPPKSTDELRAALVAAEELLTEPSRETRRRILIGLETLVCVMLALHVAGQLATAGRLPAPARDLVMIPLLAVSLASAALYNRAVLRGRRAASPRLDALTRWGTVLLLQAAALVVVHQNPNTATSMLADNALSIVLVVITGVIIGRRAAIAWFAVFLGSLWVAVQRRGPDFLYVLMTPAELQAMSPEALAARTLAGQAAGLAPIPATLFALVMAVFGGLALLVTFVEAGMIGRVLSAIPRATERIRVATDRATALAQAHTRLEAEMELAQRLQAAMVPRSAALRGHDVASVYRPALDVGGDYYDVIETTRSSWVLIGDVSGHGVSAGLIMMMAQTAARTAIESFEASGAALTPTVLLATVNAALRENLERIGRGQYMTVTALRFDGDRITYAGLHQDLLVHRAATGAVERVETNGVWLGLVDDLGAMMSDATLTLAPGDLLLLHTDGATEARRGRTPLGVEWLIERLRHEAPAQPRADGVVTALARSLEALEGVRIDDDLTLVAVRRAPLSASGTG